MTDFASYLTQERGLGPKTLEVYRRYLSLYQQWLQGRPEMPETAVAYIATFKAESTRMVVASALRNYFIWKYPDGSPLKVKVRRSRSLPQPISRGMLWQVVRQAKGSMRLLVLIMAFAGLRVSEACELRTSNLLTEAQALRLVGKGKKERIIHIPSSLFTKLKVQSEGRRTGSPFFPGTGDRKCLSRFTVNSALREIGEKIGAPDLHPHQLRHFYATWLYALTNDAFRVAREMGHSNVQTTFGYAGLVDPPAHIKTMEDLMKEVLA